MEDLFNKISTLEEVKGKFTEEEIKTVFNRNYGYSTELLKERLLNARILYSSSTKNFFSSITVIFTALAIIMSLWAFNQNYESSTEIIRFLSSILIVVAFIVLYILAYILIKRFGTNIKDVELEMRIIPFILDSRLKNKEIKEKKEGI